MVRDPFDNVCFRSPSDLGRLEPTWCKTTGAASREPRAACGLAAARTIGAKRMVGGRARLCGSALAPARDAATISKQRPDDFWEDPVTPPVLMGSAGRIGKDDAREGASSTTASSDWNAVGWCHPLMRITVGATPRIRG
jgi:hypothetical protein